MYVLPRSALFLFLVKVVLSCKDSLAFLRI